MEIQYEVVEREETSEENGKYTGYGLRCTYGEASAAVEDISPERSCVERLAAMLERERVEPVHLYDVLYDLIADNAISG